MMKKNCFVKEKGQKERQLPSGRVMAIHQIAGGIKEGFVRGHLCLCRTIWLSAAATNLPFACCPCFTKQMARLPRVLPNKEENVKRSVATKLL